VPSRHVLRKVVGELEIQHAQLVAGIGRDLLARFRLGTRRRRRRQRLLLLVRFHRISRHFHLVSRLLRHRPLTPISPAYTSQTNFYLLYTTMAR